jgi:hypothetical protein
MCDSSLGEVHRGLGSHLLLQLTFLFDASFPLLPPSVLEKGQCLESSTEKCGPGQSHRGRR